MLHSNILLYMAYVSNSQLLLYTSRGFNILPNVLWQNRVYLAAVSIWAAHGYPLEEDSLM